LFGKLLTEMSMSETKLALDHKMAYISKMLTNYLSILKNLREKHSLLFVMHVFFVGGAVLSLLLVMFASVYRWF